MFFGQKFATQLRLDIEDIKEVLSDPHTLNSRGLISLIPIQIQGKHRGSRRKRFGLVAQALIVGI